MVHTASQEHDLTLAQLEALVAQRADAADQPQLLSFVRHYFETVPTEILAAHTPPELFAIAHGHWVFARDRPGAEPKVRVYTPRADEEGWNADLTVLETVVTDMPFLVDSLTMAVRALGSGISWLVHPVLRLRRDASGRLSEVSSAEAGSDGDTESLVHLEFLPRLDESACQALAEDAGSVLRDLRLVVDDYAAMRELMQAKVRDLDKVPEGQDPKDVAEVQAMLKWLLDDHFTFLGAAESEVVSDERGDRLVQKAGSGLGLLRSADGDSGFVAPAQELDKYARSPRMLIVTKGNERSRLHHPEYFDAVVVKSFDDQGEVLGAYRFLGLFSSEVYNTLPRRIPGVRRKIEKVMQGSRLREGSHAAKQLREILDNLPRDELFQSSEQELADLALGIRAVRETQQLRLFMRRDRYGRFFSCLVYLDRERYSPEARTRMGRSLLTLLEGLELEHHVHFQRDGLARVHFIVRTPPGTEAHLSTREIEERLIASTRSWDDELRSYLCKILPDADALRLAERFRGAFPASYRELAAPVDAATDVQYLNRLDEQHAMLVRLLELQEDDCSLRLKIYVKGEPIALSDVLPTLENFGLRVKTQHPFEVRRGDGVTVWIQEFDMQQTGVCVLTTGRLRSMFEEAFHRSWKGEVENDGINALIISAGLDWRQAALLRSVCKYLLQTGMPFSQAYIESILYENAAIAHQLVQLFEARFDPQGDADRAARVSDLADALIASLDGVSSLDADRVLRGFLTVIQACLRTNFYQRGPDGQPKAYISFKLDPRRIPELPEPRPVFEAFVYAPEVEGIHLRGGKVARGGLRWSDRREDFRTEVLGLVKAQMVKNSVIVPVGAKGGFVVKKKLDPTDRESFMAAGIECYKTFVRGLLDITDNYSGSDVLPPPDVVRHDDDDPYLVVAADKGTATFSDIANGISAEYNFWLGDAFASGGSAGYDHKKMGITARGAWESVKRHFREMDIDCQTQDFTCVGIGDMAGDVFGNGMLLSRHIRLLAAFNHLHIFIDPNPDAETSFAERKRLFEKPRSSWTDYDKALISEGGGIFERKAKSIKLSQQARESLGIEAESLTPNELIREILKAPVDLFWNGGIGTYVKARSESHQAVGDRANDALRIDGRELRCKLVGEGGNLGCTQRGRIEYSQNGGRIITDFIDNAGGVNSSDREVNIKIPLNDLMRQGDLQREDRDRVLESMTADVARGVLRDSYLQTLAISLHQKTSVTRIGEHMRLMRLLEKDGLLKRAIEFLPDDEQIADRRSNNQGLTRPEIAVLVSYSKISLFQSVLDSSLPDDEALSEELLAYFPAAMTERFAEAIKGHRLRREIIATLITNQVVNRMGMSHAHRVAAEQGVPRADTVKAYLLASRIFDAPKRWRAIEELDLKLSTELQYALLERVMGLLKHSSMWLISHDQIRTPIGTAVPPLAGAVAELEAALGEVLPPAYREQWDALNSSMTERGVPDDVARMYADHHVLGSGLDIAQLAQNGSCGVVETAKIYFLVGQKLSMPWLLEEIVRLSVDGRWHALARASLRDKAYQLHRDITARVMSFEAADAGARVEAWAGAHARQVQFAATRIEELLQSGGVDFLGLTVAVSDLQRLVADDLA